MTPKEIKEHIDRGTFMSMLMDAMEMRTHEDNGKVKLELIFPHWYHEHVSVESRAEIEALVRENCATALQKADE